MSTDSNGKEISISRTTSGFPAYLDFKSLRTDAINYLGPITKKYWTDYNIHDPGITLLEELMYAILDLGYRVNFPIEDLLARNPLDKTEDVDFFTPAELLGCNPLTLFDYRKILMDIDEVRNAWLEIDKSFQTTGEQMSLENDAASTKEANPYLNGLYQVYLELVMDKSDFATTAAWEAYKEMVHKKVKSTLNTHRNICEDFEKIHFLEKFLVGVHADIELDPDAVPAGVYQALSFALQNFLSPAPPYYNLGQLTELNIPTDQIFEGRPYTGMPSHGFILDEDLPDRPSSKTPIYLSAVFQCMLQVEGVKTVRKLQLLNPENKKQAEKWELQIKGDRIPAFSLSDSRFNWYKNGQLLSLDLSSYNDPIRMNFIHAGKILYPAGPPALDQAIPAGVYMEDLGKYYSVQNDFPLVYGIGQGGLPSTASALRQSQALQFKGFILFFDQLLANYLSQLANVRTIFSISSSPGQNNSKTFFTGDLSQSDLAGLDTLLRFPAADGSKTGGGADPGSILLFPVDIKDWNTITQNGEINCNQLRQLNPKTFVSSSERNVAVEELALAFFAPELQPKAQYVQTDSGRFIYFFSWPWINTVLVSKNDFATQNEADTEIYSVLFIAASKENYNLLSIADAPSFGFNLVQSGNSYFNYFQSMLEDPAQFKTRRTIFLEHLLSRFAESFTDYVLLSAGFESQDAINNNQIGLLEKFITDFPALSANRNKAYDYSNSGWGNENISGYEKRFEAYCGIANRSQHYLCHFEVLEYEGKFNIRMTLAGEDVFICPGTFQEKETIPAVHSLYENISDRGNLRPVFHDDKKGYVIEVHIHDRYTARSVTIWESEREAAEGADQICKMWKLIPGEEDLWVSEYEYRAELLDHHKKIVRTAVPGFQEEHLALMEGKRMLKKINDKKVWKFDDDLDPSFIGELHHNQDTQLKTEYFDVSGFNIYEKEVVDKEGRYRFEVLDKHVTFQFESLNDFDSKASAKSACRQFLHYLTDTSNFSIRKDPYENIFRIWIHINGEDLAVGEKEFRDKETATLLRDRIVHDLHKKLYSLRVIPAPFRWKFNFYLGLPSGNSFFFSSSESYSSRHAARQAAEIFHQHGSEWNIKEKSGELRIQEKSSGKDISCLLVKTWHQQEKPAKELVKEARHLLNVKKDLYKLKDGDNKLMEKMVSPDDPSKENTWIYRLVDKDHPKAFHYAHAKITEKDEAEIAREKLILKGRRGYLYPEICLGGDNVRFDESTGEYYFQIRCRNDYFNRKGIPTKYGELVLFESTESYESADTAQQAFQNNYLTILKRAMESQNYEENNSITLKYSTGRPGAPGVVQVPPTTKDAFAYASLNTIQELAGAANAYPIRITSDGYRFVLVNDETKILDWESFEHFLNPGNAHTAFEFFRLLLNYPGNYFIEFNEPSCSFRIGIREVLAESSTSFQTLEDAWGPAGVEKFICAAQANCGFHLSRRKDCSYTYFIGCRNHRSIHPCHYDSPEKRDRALSKLFKEANRFPKQGWITAITQLEFTILDGETGNALARIPLPPDEHSDEEILNHILDMEDALWKGNQFGEDGDGIYLSAGNDPIRIRPGHKISHVDNWEKELLTFAAYFPVTRTRHMEGGETNSLFGMAIKMPGFVDLPGTKIKGKDCGCSSPDRQNIPVCYEAWTSDRNYNHAKDAWKDYNELLPLLSEPANYKPVFDAECGCYGIELYEKKDIIASNPQYYIYPSMATDALNRAILSVNTEGLHLVEHILLRPEKKMINGRRIPVCADETECAKVWEAIETNTPASQPSVYFYPGKDPYSFIITLTVPAWPLRFRKKENRVLLESILQREAPSHLLVRILWLTPMDMCRFESLYKDWKYEFARQAGWAKTTPCRDFDKTGFIDFLFKTSVSCLSDCTACEEESDEDQNKTDTTGITKLNDEWLSQISRLYCWEDTRCADTSGWRKQPHKNLQDKQSAERVNEEIVRKEFKTDQDVNKSAYLENSQDRRTVSTKRAARYQQRVSALADQYNEKIYSGRVALFITDPDPTDRLENEIRILTKVASGKPGKSGKKGEPASKKYIKSLVEIMIAFCLDQVSIDPGDGEKWDHLEKIMREQKIRFEDPDHFYQQWDIAELRQFVREPDDERIQSVIRAGK